MKKLNLLTIISAALLLSCGQAAQADMKGQQKSSVTSVFGRAGIVTSAAGDYTAANITNTPAGNIAAITAQAAINELDTEKAGLSGATFTGSVTPTGRLIMPVGQVDYFNVTGTAVTLASASDGATNLVAISPATAATIDTCFDNGGSNNGALRYTCATTKYAYIAVTLSMTPTQADDVFVLGVAKNDTVGTACKAVGSSGGTQLSSLHCIMSIAQNDVITLKLGNTSAGRDTTVKSLNIAAVLM